MALIKTSEELQKMVIAGSILKTLKNVVRDNIRAGVSTLDLEEAANYFLNSCRSLINEDITASFQGHTGVGGTYKNILCTSVNNVIVHGIPSAKTILKNGDLLSVDSGICYEGCHADSAFSVIVGGGTHDLIVAVEDAFRTGLFFCKPGNRTSDISHAIQVTVEEYGYHVMLEFAGHGIGTELHEYPQIKNCGRSGYGIIIKPGMVFAIEPVIAEKKCSAVLGSDRWAYRTSNGCLSSHYEHTVIVTEDGPKIIT